MNPMEQLRRSRDFWRFTCCVSVPSMFLALIFLTHYVHTEQGQARARVAHSLSLPVGGR